jgi:hypothetical protein
MTEVPKLPMHPSDLPQQRVYEVVSLPPRPARFEFGVGYSGFPLGVKPKQGVPRSPELLIQVEWAETIYNSGVEAFYLQARRKHWLLWLRGLDDNACPWRWDWALVGYCNRAGVEKVAAASHLLLEYWRQEKLSFRRDPYDWVNEEGFLSVADIRAIVRELKAQRTPTV